MPGDRVDIVLDEWTEESPDLSTEALGIVLRVQVLEKMMSDQLRAALTKLDLEWFEYDVLSALRRQGEPFQMSSSDIAESSLVSPGALTNRIDRLIERNLVTRSEDPEDRRRMLISLTQKGMRLVDKAKVKRFQCAEEAVQDLSSRDQERLNSLLSRLVRYAEKNAED